MAEVIVEVVVPAVPLIVETVVPVAPLEVELGLPGPIGPIGLPGVYDGAVAESSPDPVLLFENALI